MIIESTLNQIKESLRRLVFEGKEPIVFAITGGWGEGKTHFWKKSILPMFAEHRPGYVSVFGAEDIGSIRERVLIAAGQRLSLDDDEENSSAVEGEPNAWLTQAGTVFSKMLKKTSDKIGLPSSFVDQLMEKYLLEENRVVCIDDIERLSKDVGTDTFLGYVNELREEHRLKVVLIFNDNWFAENNDKKFAHYREKVIDYEVPFIPDLNDVVRYATKDEITSKDKVRDEIVQHCQNLNLRNIRVLGKAIRYFNEVAEVLPNNPNAEFLAHALQSLILFSWIKFSSDPTVKFSHLKKYSSMTASMTRILHESQGMVDDDQAETPPAEQLLEKYGYRFTDDLDVILLNLVISGVLVKKELLAEYQKHVTETSRGKLYDANHETWQTMFHGTFRDNTEEFCEQLVATTRAYLEHMSVEQIDTVLKRLEDLGHGDDAAALFSTFMQKRPTFYENYQSESSFSNPLQYNPMIAAIEESKVSSEKDERSLLELFGDIWEQERMKDEDHKRLATFDASDVVEYFLSHDQKKITRKLLTLLQVTRGASSEDALKNKETLDTVVESLSEMNEINRLRLRSMGLPPMLDNSEQEK